MNTQLRRRFDQQLERVLGQLPPEIQGLLDRVPMVVEDYPSRHVMQQTGVARRDDLCGLFTGIPLTERSVDHSGVLSDVIHIYRRGVYRAAADPFGRVGDERLREEIRVTILHELGHHFGLDEDDLRELGYG